MEKNTMAIIHFSPIELYPPVMNLLDYLGEKMPFLQVHVFTNEAEDLKEKYVSKQGNVIIERIAANNLNFSVIRRYRNYFNFYFIAYQNLKRIRPEWIWYFETISALPVSWYYARNKSTVSELFIHYHEYMSRAEYEDGPKLIKWIHRKEKKLYQIARSVSQTNEKRLDFFLKDNQLSLVGKTYVLPNYPPLKWITNRRENLTKHLPVRIIYVGVIGMHSLYIKEFCKWVDMQNGKVVFDIYSQQDTEELKNWISSKNYRFCELKGFVPYTELPGVLSNYQVGVILYKGHIPNYIYNAPNKLFEYWACGLDVWFPVKMTGSLPFSRKDTIPKLLAINFEDLDHFDLESAIDHKDLGYKASPYFFEQILDSFLPEIMGRQRQIELIK